MNKNSLYAFIHNVYSRDVAFLLLGKLLYKDANEIAWDVQRGLSLHFLRNVTCLSWNYLG